LVQAVSYFTVAKYSMQASQRNSANWAAFMVQFLLGLVDAILLFGFNLWAEGSWFAGLVAVFGAIGSQAAFCVCLWCKQHGPSDLSEMICIPLMFFCHLLANAVSAWRTVQFQKGIEEELPDPPQTGSEERDVYYRRMSFRGAEDRPARRRSKKQGRARRSTTCGRRVALSVGDTFAVSAWLLCLVWAGVHSVHKRERVLGAGKARRLRESSSWAPEGLATDSFPSIGVLDHAGLSAYLGTELEDGRRWRAQMEDRLSRVRAALGERRARHGRAVLTEAMGELLANADWGAGLVAPPARLP